MRKIQAKIFSVIETDNQGIVSKIYDCGMIIVILLSLIPLAFKENYMVFSWIENISVSIFILDYALRWMTADCKLQKEWISFFLYPFTWMALIDLLSILPSVQVLNSGFKLLRIVRLIRCFRVFRTFKLLRYSKNISILVRVFQKQKRVFGCVGSFALAYIIISALIIFNVEPDTFHTFFDAVYWATVSLTTMGYGDIYPITVAGRIVTMISSILGIAIVALPAGIITAGYMDEIHNDDKNIDTED